MLASCFVCQEETGGFNYYVSTNFVPFQVSRIHFGCQTNLVTIDYHEVTFYLNFAIEMTMHRVILKHVCQVFWVQKVVDTYNLNVVAEVFYCGAEYHTANAAESIDTKFNHFAF